MVKPSLVHHHHQQLVVNTIMIIIIIIIIIIISSISFILYTNIFYHSIHITPKYAPSHYTNTWHYTNLTHLLAIPGTAPMLFQLLLHQRHTSHREGPRTSGVLNGFPNRYTDLKINGWFTYKSPIYIERNQASVRTCSMLIFKGVTGVISPLF